MGANEASKVDGTVVVTVGIAVEVDSQGWPISAILSCPTPSPFLSIDHLIGE